MVAAELDQSQLNAVPLLYLQTVISNGGGDGLAVADECRIVLEGRGGCIGIWRSDGDLPEVLDDHVGFVTHRGGARGLQR